MNDAHSAGAAAFWRRAARYREFARNPVTRKWARRCLSDLCAGVEHPILLPSRLAGLPIDLDLSDGTDRDIYLFGRSDSRGVAVLERVMERLDCRTAWDVGTNRGNHAAFMRLHCQKLLCFEPNPAEYSRAKTVLSGASNVAIFNVGLSSAGGKLPFYIDHKAQGSSSFELEGRQPNFFAEVNTGDDFCKTHNVENIDL